MANFEDIRDILIGQLALKADMIKPESKLADDLGADSLDAMELVSAIEERFEISISDEEATSIVCVSDIEKLIQLKLKEKETA